MKAYLIIIIGMLSFLIMEKTFSLMIENERITILREHAILVKAHDVNAINSHKLIMDNLGINYTEVRPNFTDPLDHSSEGNTKR